MDYQAHPNDDQDDSVAIQNAFDDLPPSGGTVYFPAGTFDIKTEIQTTTINVTKPCTVLGSGPRATVIRTWNTAANLFSVQLPNGSAGAWLPVVFRDMSLQAIYPTPGVAINYAVAPPPPAPPIAAQWAWGFRAESVHFTGPFSINLRITSGAAFIVDKCHFQGAANHEIYVDNEINADVGDSVITNSYFFALTPNVFSAILHRGGGGLKVLGNKFLGYKYHYYNDMSLGVAPEPTGILHFANNSSEFASISNLFFYGSEAYDAVSVQDNDFSLGVVDSAGQLVNCPSSTTAIKVQTQNGGAHRVSLITGNVFRQYLAGQSCTAITFLPAGPGQATDWRVADNNFSFVPTAISIGSAAERIQVGENKYSFVTTKMVSSSTSSGNYLQLINNPSGLALATQPDAGYLFVQNGVLKFKDTNGVTKTIVLQ